MSFSSALRGPEYIEPSALREILVGPGKGQDSLLVIDVRDDDFEGGHIPSAVNKTSELFEDDDNIDEMIADGTLDIMNKTLVVFHCMLSQVRGPTCARRLKSRLDVLRDDGDAQGSSAGGQSSSLPKVVVLRGGFEGWVGLHNRDPERDKLIADFIPSFWPL